MNTKHLAVAFPRRADWLSLCAALLACLGLALGALTADAQAKNTPVRAVKSTTSQATKSGPVKAQAAVSAPAGKRQAATVKKAAQGRKADLKKTAKGTGTLKAASASGKKQTGQEAAAPSAPAGFSRADVERLASDLASKAYVSPKNETPEFLRKLSYEQWTELRFREEVTFWRSEKLPFELQFFHPGSVYDTPVRIHIVDKGRVQDMTFSQDMFVAGSPELAEKLKGLKLNFAGFRLLYPIRGGIHRDEIASFLGATYFRALSRDAGYGLSALGLSINTAVPGAEEFPNFTEFWIVKPAPGDNSVFIHALMNSPSMTGAYTFEVTPGETTFMDVTCTLFERNSPRNGRKLGIAPLASMFLSGGEQMPDSPFKPEVHNSDGLLLKNAEGNWLWSPLNNPRRLETYTFSMDDPRGFGLMQRDVEFAHYQDVTARYDLRPSLWVEPQGQWGKGHMELIEIPTSTVIHNNILAFWVPDSPATQKPGETAPAGHSYAYRMHWMRPGAAPHSLGRVSDTRADLSTDGSTASFVVEFTGKELNSLPADTGLFCPLELPPNVSVTEKKLLKNQQTGGWTLSFTARLPKEEGFLQNLLPNRPNLAPLRFRAMLKRGENLPDPLTEVWNYDLQR